MATDAQIDDLVSLYVGYFGRVPDPEGLQFWIDQIDNGREYGTIAGDFAGSIEAKALYPFLDNAEGVSPASFVATVYQNLFNREADAAGEAFWIGVLAGGTVAVGDMIESIINGAVDAPTAEIPTFDAQVLANKGSVGLNFVTQSYAYSNLNYEIQDLSAFLEPVTSAPVSVIIAQQEVDAFLEGLEPLDITGPMVKLTTDVDVFSQSEGRINISTTIDGIENENSLQSFDDINAGSGIDHLNAKFNNAGTVMPTLASVENISIEAINGPSTLDLANATGVEQVWNNGSAGDLTFQNMDLSTVAGLTGSDLAGSTTFNYAGSDGSNDAAILALKGSTGISSDLVTLNSIEDLTIFIDSVDTNAFLTKFVAGDVNSIKLIGDANAFQLLNNDVSDLRNLEVLDASGFTGDFRVNFDFAPSDQSELEPNRGLTVTGSSDGGDTIRLTRASNDDVIVFNETAGSTLDDRTVVIYFNHLDGDDKIDISAFGLGPISALGSTDFDPTSDVASFFLNAGSAVVQSTARLDWIYVDTNNNGDFDADTDLAVNIAGVASIGDFILV